MAIDSLLQALGLRKDSALVSLAAQADFLFSLLALFGLLIVVVWFVVALGIEASRRRWDRVQYHLLWLLVALLLAIYCAASVINSMDSLNMLPA